MLALGKVAKREDAMLDKINELVQKRESTLRQIEAWELTDPNMVEILDDIRLHLL